MTVEVAGSWELGWNSPIKEAELFEYPLRDFGVDVFHMAPVSGIRANVIEHHDLGELIVDRRSKGVPIVFVDEKGAAPLRSFQHPESALYVCGRTSLSALTAYGLPEDQSVRIETVANGGMLWAHQSIAIVLYDRLCKGSSGPWL
jgi:hypothetical protein